MASTCQAGYENMCTRSNDGGVSSEAVCCPSGESLACCSTNGYCCDTNFSSLHWGFAIPLLCFAVLQPLLICLRRKGAPKCTICFFSIFNFVFWLLISLGVAPLCGEDAVQQAQTTTGGPWHRNNDPFSPVGDCTTNMLICWGIACGFWVVTGCFALCRAKLKEDTMVIDTPAEIIERTRNAKPALSYSFSCHHTITTHGTDAQGNRTTNTSVVTTKSGNIPIDLDPYFEDITPNVPPALATKDHATELELHETYQCSPQLELYRRAIKAAVDAQWRNFDSGYSSHFSYSPQHVATSKVGRGTYLCFPNKTEQQLEARASRNYYFACCNCFMASYLACRKKDTVKAKFDVTFRIFAAGERNNRAQDAAAVAAQAVMASRDGAVRGAPRGRLGPNGLPMQAGMQANPMASGGAGLAGAINPLYGLDTSAGSPQQQQQQQLAAMQAQYARNQQALMAMQQQQQQQQQRGGQSFSVQMAPMSGASSAGGALPPVGGQQLPPPRPSSRRAPPPPPSRR